MKKIQVYSLIVWALILCSCLTREQDVRIVKDFNFNWNFKLGAHPEAVKTTFDSSDWRTLNLPHDWSIEGAFSKDHPTKPEGGALPAGEGWYRKSFQISEEWKEKTIAIEFDGVYRNSEVWINGKHLGKRPNGYISFSYDLTPYLHYGTQENIITVKVDNSLQPNSRWYTGSGIYRKVQLVVTNKLHIAHWGTYITTPKITKELGEVAIEITLQNDTDTEKSIELVSLVYDENEQEVAKIITKKNINSKESVKANQTLEVKKPILWDTKNPYLYTVKTKVYEGATLVDNFENVLGFRSFNFDAEKGFSLNGVPTKIHGVCLHHDNGALGAVASYDAIKRKLRLMKEMGVNAIRVSHNPSSVELLDLCDKMGFIVQAEAFDVWKKKKVKADYHLDWDEWHKKDLQDFVKRDRNHPSVMMWSIGNEIREQFDSTGIAITKELVNIVKKLDQTRPVTSALTENIPEKNYIYQSGALDLLGFNYKHEDYTSFPEKFKGQKIIASESVSALETRGHYDHFDADEIKRWPPAHNQPFDGNDDFTVSAYDQVSAYWGATHEESWEAVKALDYIAGTFIWTGMDYLGEPIPYPYPARSSYFGIVDLAGFPKDVYYMYQSEWSDQEVLHIFPHWNWTKNQEVDVWAYYNHADEVELFLNGKSLGKKSKKGDDLHVSWKVKYEPGILKAISRKDGKVILEKEIHTAGKAAQINLTADKKEIHNNQYDLAYITVDVVDEKGVLVPNANHLIEFEISGGGEIVGVDNGYQANLSSFKASEIKAYNGKCLVIVQSNGKEENIVLKATSSIGISSNTIEIKVKK
ncbi:glycoside hydrolase family 2 TIM barrel-domain containing protein [Wenyingzhuangia sp. chi5]|uniref:Glycoside hydrolase family 2 TIM barrel-domain containing protein n=1 Tax=Wenyingzhuangia gilva TaxID=3057677 RepID=A0ABT8VTK5_9FLAO|nr:sugar-binding domain-containing protein [Wenyingzhuangia sp. chi5]MDO3695310.1 glycoside hydrolase family 2 TIM barrel-domain containing protein [Wenyingzhuangia sp. chi5]